MENNKKINPAPNIDIFALKNGPDRAAKEGRIQKLELAKAKKCKKNLQFLQLSGFAQKK